MTENFPTVPTVWVLIFDQYPEDAASRESRDSHCTGGLTPTAHQGSENAFDRLDLESTCFEQFLLQDVRSEIRTDDVFGGESAFMNLSEAITAAGQTASLVSLTADGASITAHADCNVIESSMRRCRMPLNAVESLDCRNVDQVNSVVGGSSNVDLAFSASLVWMEANTLSTTNSVTAAKQMLDFVFSRLQSRSVQEEKCPVLMVTFRRGDDLIVREPLQSGIAENRMHVPLWIRPNAGHACRVQALSGSFDLLPTIATFLGSTAASDEASPLAVAQIADSSERVIAAAPPLSSEPRSLAFLCGAPQVCPDRLLKLRGDEWKAARTEGFLLVIMDSNPSASEKTESDGDESEEPSRRLFVKPEDRFNVNNVSGTYATVADELVRLLK